MLGEVRTEDIPNFLLIEKLLRFAINTLKFLSTSSVEIAKNLRKYVLIVQCGSFGFAFSKCINLIAIDIGILIIQVYDK